MKDERISFTNNNPLSYDSVYKFDEYDIKIIRELDTDGRKSLADISLKVKLSRDAVKNRIKKLVSAGVIKSFKPLFNPPNMGFPIINYVFISLYNPSEKKESEFLEYLKKNKHVTYIAGLIGKWDYIIDVMAENQGKFDKILKEIRQKFPDMIKDYEVYGVLNEYKYEEIGRLVYEK